MTKRVPTDFPNTSPLRRGPQMALQNVLLCPWSSNSIGKNPVVRIGVQTALQKFLQWLGKLGIDRKRLAGGFGFGLTRPAVYHSPSYQNREVGPIEVAPLQAHDFACAKAKTGRNQNHRAVWLGQLAEQATDFRIVYDPRYRSTSPTLPHQVNGVAVSQLPSSSVFINNVKQASQIDLGFRRQR